VSPEETARRLNADTIERPFRGMEDPVPVIARMIDERDDLYRRADLSIPTDGRSTESIAYEIETIVRVRALAAYQSA
jgi:shikimate kinase